MIHDHVAHGKEGTWRQRLGEEVGQVVDAADEGDHDLQLLDLLAHEEVASVDVLGSCMVLRVVGQVDRSFIIDVDWCGAAWVSPNSAKRARR